MPIGDTADAAGYLIVPETGEEGRVRWGAREINRTRDYLATLKALIPTGKSGYRDKTGITSGTADPAPASGSDGDIYFKIIS
jgi:hypothetical protein